jgi:hypothetical protein
VGDEERGEDMRGEERTVRNEWSDVGCKEVEEEESKGDRI